MEEVILGNYSDAVAQLRIAEELGGDDYTAFTAALLAYGYHLMSRDEETARLLDEYQRRLSENSGGRELSAVWASLAIETHQEVLESLEQMASRPNGLNLRVHEFRVNSWNDPILDRPEFVEVRSRLGFRE